MITTNGVYHARVPVIQVFPITEWNEKNGQIIATVVVEPDPVNGLSKKSVADCLQTRPLDHRVRLKKIVENWMLKRFWVARSGNINLSDGG